MLWNSCFHVQVWITSELWLIHEKKLVWNSSWCSCLKYVWIVSDPCKKIWWGKKVTLMFISEIPLNVLADPWKKNGLKFISIFMSEINLKCVWHMWKQNGVFMFRSELPLNFGWHKKKKLCKLYLHVHVWKKSEIEKEKWLTELCLNQVKKSKKKTN